MHEDGKDLHGNKRGNMSLWLRGLLSEWLNFGALVFERSWGDGTVISGEPIMDIIPDKPTLRLRADYIMSKNLLRNDDRTSQCLITVIVMLSKKKKKYSKTSLLDPLWVG
jgi:hypothetical protein